MSIDLEKLFTAKEEAWQAVQHFNACNIAGKTAAERVELDLSHARAYADWEDKNFEYQRAIKESIKRK